MYHYCIYYWHICVSNLSNLLQISKHFSIQILARQKQIPRSSARKCDIYSLKALKCQLHSVLTFLQEAKTLKGVKSFSQLQKDNFRLLRSSEPILISYKFWISNPIKGFWEVHQNPSKLSLTIQNLKLNRRLHLFYEIYHWFKWF